MNKLAIFLIFFHCAFLIIAQDKMIVDKPIDGYTFYGNCSIDITSMDSIPPRIQHNINGYLKRIMGTMSEKVKFSYGQIVDIKEYFRSDSSTFNYEWVIPRYDLRFELRDLSVGIKCFELKIDLDEYGQIITSNWPKRHYSDKTKFLSRAKIESCALTLAKAKGYNTKEYLVDFDYNESFDRLCWIFKFPISADEEHGEYNVIEIDWQNTDNIREYKYQTMMIID